MHNNISSVHVFRKINFRSCHWLRNYFLQQNFPDLRYLVMHYNISYCTVSIVAHFLTWVLKGLIINESTQVQTPGDGDSMFILHACMKHVATLWCAESPHLWTRGNYYPAIRKFTIMQRMSLCCSAIDAWCRMSQESTCTWTTGTHSKLRSYIWIKNWTVPQMLRKAKLPYS